MKAWFEFLVVSLLFTVVTTSQYRERLQRNAASSDAQESEAENGRISPKVLVIMFDGFRWDYYDKYKKELYAFEQFFTEGVQTEWVESIFPSVSYPSWTTISTGLFPESHGILGNYMYNKKTRMAFDLFNTTSTTQEEWWQHAEPIWTTATKEGKDVFLRLWSRCDVPFQGIIPKEFSGFAERRGKEAISETLQIAAHKIKDHALVMVYNEHIDNLGHKYGPDSSELKQGLLDVNEAFNKFLDTLMDDDLYDNINIIIVSDHGMIGVGPNSNTTYLYLGDYISPSDVNIVLDRGAAVAIDTYSSTLEEVYKKLKTNMPGVDVYKRHEIPESFHYKNNDLAHDILVVAKPQHFVYGLNSSKQFPLDAEFGHWGGIHGYPDMKEMSGIFFAKGPNFKKGAVHPPIRLEDIYQVIAKALEITPRPHNGSWDRVYTLFLNSSTKISCSSGVYFILLTTLSVLSSLLSSARVQ